jgi:hypothetical protein
MQYLVKCRFSAQYLQARFSEKAKEELLKDARKTVVRNVTEEDEVWLRLSYFDEFGYYIPGEQIKMSLVNSARDFKMKAKRSSLKDWAKATLFIKGENNYLGRKEPDELLTSYPKRKDGSRVKIIHPSFKIGTEFEFMLECLDKDFNKKTLQEIIENAGKKCGIGARRPEFGRFELVEIKEQ